MSERSRGRKGCCVFFSGPPGFPSKSSDRSTHSATSATTKTSHSRRAIRLPEVVVETPCPNCISLARPRGLEPLTSGSAGQRSIH